MAVVVVTMFLYLIRMISVGIAMGILFIKIKLFNKMNKKQVMVIGIASTPMFVSFADYLLGLIFIGWSSGFYYIVPLAIAIVWILCLKNYQIALCTIKGIYDFIKSVIKKVRKWIFLDLILSLSAVFFTALLFNETEFLSDNVLPLLYAMNIMGKLIAVALLVSIIIEAIFIVKQMYKDGSLATNGYLFLIIVFLGCSIFVGMSFNGRPDFDSDAAHYQLEARYFTEDKNSWEVDNYVDEKYGSSLRDDHGPLWVLYIADGQMQAEMVGMDNPVRICNFAILWAYCCFCVLMFLFASYIAGTYRSGVISLFLFALYQYDILMLLGSRDAFRFIGLLILVLYVCNIIPEIIADRGKGCHYGFMCLFCFLSMNGHEGNVYIMLGMFLIVVLLLIVSKTRIKNFILCGSSVLLGTLLGILKTIFLYLETGRISSSSILAFHDTPVVQQITEINNNRAEWETIWETYTRPVRFMMGIGLIALVAMILVSMIKRDKRLFLNGMIIVGMLLPMTGIMNWIGYEVSRWFAEQLRYRMYFLMLFAITGGWLLTRLWGKYVRYVFNVLIVLVFGLYLNVGYERISTYNRQHIENCKLSIERYIKLAEICEFLTEGDVFTNNQIILYYLHGTPKLLFHIYTEELIQAKTEEEIKTAMDKLNVGAIILPEDGLDYHDYSMLPFWQYINEDESFSQMVDKGSRYTIFYRDK